MLTALIEGAGARPTAYSASDSSKDALRPFGAKLIRLLKRQVRVSFPSFPMALRSKFLLHLELASAPNPHVGAGSAHEMFEPRWRPPKVFGVS